CPLPRPQPGPLVLLYIRKCKKGNHTKVQSVQKASIQAFPFLCIKRFTKQRSRTNVGIVKGPSGRKTTLIHTRGSTKRSSSINASPVESPLEAAPPLLPIKASTERRD
uniref:Uncharacterized protein n=1 Tax=Naja naja TaxID=35670 RepID=A0A8C6V8R8_NAJNA